MKTEIVAPAGTPDRLTVALAYGADAVYLGAGAFDLRAGAGSFFPRELSGLVERCHENDTRLLLTVNAMPRENEMPLLVGHLNRAEEAKVDALIVSDPGVFRVATRECSLPIHVSTQASCANLESALFWGHSGARRIVLARELSVEDAGEIREKSGLEVEVFLHGSRCSSWSGMCGLSSHLTGRDANRGECMQACRLEWNEENRDSQFPFSATDLDALPLMPRILKANIDAVKLEGRNRSPVHLALSLKAARLARELAEQGQGEKIAPRVASILAPLSRRISDDDFLSGKARPDRTAPAGINPPGIELAGIVLQSDSRGSLLKLSTRCKTGDIFFRINPDGEDAGITVGSLRDFRGERLDRAVQEQCVLLDENLPAGSVLYTSGDSA